MKAYDRSANREAVALLEQALGALAHLPESRETLERAVDLRLSLYPALSTLGAMDRARAILGEAERAAVALDDPRRLGWVSGALAQDDYLAGEYAGALEHGSRALESARVTGDIDLRVVSTVYLGFSYEVLGRFRRATEYFREALALLEGERRRERYGMRSYPASFARAYLGLALAEMGEFGEAIRSAEEGREIAEEVGHAHTRSLAQHWLAWAYLLHGQLDPAIQAAEQGVRLAQETESALMVVWNASHLGAALTEAGRVAEGLPWLEQAVETAVKQHIKVALSLLVSRLGEGYFRLGRRDQALEQARRALDIARTQSERGFEAWTLRLLGEISAHGEPPDAETAEDWYRQALALAEELEMRPLVAHCHLGLAKLSARTGRRAEAHEHLATATTMYREMDMGFWLEEAAAKANKLS